MVLSILRIIAIGLHAARMNMNYLKCTVAISLLKPLHTIGKVSLNASILYKNQEICNKTNL